MGAGTCSSNSPGRHHETYARTFARPDAPGAIRRHVASADDWEWQEIAGQLYVWIDRFNDRFFGREMPEAVLSFERIDYRVLAAYTLRRNPQGLLYEITLNTPLSDAAALADVGDPDARVCASLAAECRRPSGFPQLSQSRVRGAL
jgi:hypothetical protein